MRSPSRRQASRLLLGTANSSRQFRARLADRAAHRYGGYRDLESQVFIEC